MASTFWEYASAWVDAAWSPCGNYYGQVPPDEPSCHQENISQSSSNRRRLRTNQTFTADDEILSLESCTNCSSEDSSSGGECSAPLNASLTSTAATSRLNSEEFMHGIRACIIDELVLAVDEKTNERNDPISLATSGDGTSFQSTLVSAEKELDAILQADSPMLEVLSQADSGDIATEQLDLLQSQLSFRHATDATTINFPTSSPANVQQQHYLVRNDYFDDDSTLVNSKGDVSIEIPLTKTLWKDCWFVSAHDTIMESSVYQSDNDETSEGSDIFSALLSASGHVHGQYEDNLITCDGKRSLNDLEKSPCAKRHVPATVHQPSKGFRASLLEAMDKNTVIYDEKDSNISGDIKGEETLSALSGISLGDVITTHAHCDAADGEQSSSKLETSARNELAKDADTELFRDVPDILACRTSGLTKASPRHAEVWKRRESKSGFQVVNPSMLSIAPVAKIAKETKYANVCKTSSYNGELFSVPRTCWAPENRNHSCKTDQRPSINFVSTLAETALHSRTQTKDTPSINSIANLAMYKGSHLDAIKDTPDNISVSLLSLQVRGEAVESSSLNVLYEHDDSDAESQSTGPSSDGENRGHRYRIKTGLLMLVASETSTFVDARRHDDIPEACMIDEHDSLSRLFSGWCHLHASHDNAALKTPSPRVRILKSMRVEGAVKASDVRLLLESDHDNFNEQMKNALEAVHCISTFLLLFLVPLTLASLVALVLIWARSDVCLQIALAAYCARFAYTLQAIVMVATFSSAKFDVIAAAGDISCFLGAQALQGRGRADNTCTDYHDLKTVLLYCIFFGYVALRGWQQATNECVAPVHESNTSMGPSEIIWSFKCAHEVHAIVPELHEVFQEPLGAANTTAVSRLTLLVSDPDQKACAALESELSTTDLYKRGCVRFLRRADVRFA
ncbi:hypothetical protein MPSEU_000073500 [Mayamaea pseudoterrestris]|nr:hypothetical protein MPSEU_000073500 [Mayamaea pseudoterrestris]